MNFNSVVESGVAAPKTTVVEEMTTSEVVEFLEQAKQNEDNSEEVIGGAVIARNKIKWRVVILYNTGWLRMRSNVVVERKLISGGRCAAHMSTLIFVASVMR